MPLTSPSANARSRQAAAPSSSPTALAAVGTAAGGLDSNHYLMLAREASGERAAAIFGLKKGYAFSGDEVTKLIGITRRAFYELETVQRFRRRLMS
jgi:hypothetical protein